MGTGYSRCRTKLIFIGDNAISEAADFPSKLANYQQSESNVHEYELECSIISSFDISGLKLTVSTASEMIRRNSTLGKETVSNLCLKTIFNWNSKTKRFESGKSNKLEKFFICK